MSILALALATLGGCVTDVPPENQLPRSESIDGIGACVLASDCGPGSACMYPAGTCGSVAGSCEAMGAGTLSEGSVEQGCPLEIDPVCGCDGHSYFNACDARRFGVSVDHPGDCEVPSPEPHPSDEQTCGGVTCGAGQFCFFDDGSCGAYGTSSGSCRDPKGTCTGSVLPTCGCDGQTYGSVCEAQQAGVSIAHQGPC